ncbi:MAG TPA: LamG domain-containing protein [Aeromicrobium sp.]|nr:LamG domain-containing protein [Aeromicrobium sp.]HKY58314.1 LamG domain-containing protein [Aeromicrobium sp.]
MTYLSTALALPGLLAHWRLGEAAGATVAEDASPNNRDGAYLNTPTLGATGLLSGDADKAMQTAANTGQCMSVASAAWMNVTTSLSMACRVRMTSATDTSNGDAIVSRYSGSFPWMLWRNTSGKFAVQLNAAANVADPTTVVVGQDYSAGFSYDGANIRLYVDGVQVASTPYTASLVTGSIPLEIGRYSSAASTTPGMVIDEVSVGNAVWAAADFAALHTAATTSAAVDITLALTLPKIRAALQVKKTVLTDVSNRLGGWQFGGYATARVSVPVAADPLGDDEQAFNVEAAKYLPPPTIVNGEIQ